MFQNDLFVFLIIFTYFMVVFYAAMYILYPRSGELTIDMIPAFNTWYGAMYAQLEVALIGNPTKLVTDPTLLEHLGHAELIDMALFGLLYFFYVLISIILLLNLL